MSSRRGVPQRAQNRGGRRRFIPRKSSTAPKELGLLTYGADTNWRTWCKVAEDEITINYGLLAESLNSGEWLDPPEVDHDDLDLANDPHEIARITLHQRIIAREKQIAKMHEDEPKLYAFIWKHLSVESREAVKQHEDFDEEAHKGDPLQLWLALKATHRGGGAAIDEATARTRAWQMYTHARQEPIESTVMFKERFTDLKEVYDATGNVELPAEDVASHFLNALDRSRYSQFLANIENDKAKGDAGPQTLNDAFQRAIKFVVPKTNFKATAGAAFHTADSTCERGRGRGNTGRGGSGANRGGPQGRGRGAGRVNQPQSNEKAGTVSRKDTATSSSATNDDKSGGSKRTPANGKKVVICYACGQEGHYKSECEWNLDYEEEATSGFQAFIRSGQVFATSDQFPLGMALLDNQCDMSVVRKELLSNIRLEKSYINTLAGTIELPYVGYLDGFFDCRSGDNLVVSVLCFDDVAALYPISYQPRKSFTVHAPWGNLKFYLRNKLYVGDMSDWLSQGASAHVTTVAENESKFTKIEIKRARDAWKLICNSGFSSEYDALGLVNDGNIVGVPVTAQDVRRAFQIYGKPVAYVRGRRITHKTRKKVRGVKLRDT